MAERQLRPSVSRHGKRAKRIRCAALVASFSSAGAVFVAEQNGFAQTDGDCACSRVSSKPDVPGPPPGARRSNGETAAVTTSTDQHCSARLSAHLLQVGGLGVSGVGLRLSARHCLLRLLGQLQHLQIRAAQNITTLAVERLAF